MRNQSGAGLGRKAICLLSGGLDSATALYVALEKGFAVIALTIAYGQKHDRELDSARLIASDLGLRHFVVPISLPWQGSALLDPEIAIPHRRALEDIPRDIPPTYVPARNSIFLSLAASCAEAQGAEAIFFGANAIDYSGYPDCRPEFLEAFLAMIRKGTKAGVEGRVLSMEAPLIRLTKREIVELAAKLRVPFEKTWSCYEGGQSPCGECDSCMLRAKGFQEAGIFDPLLSKGVPQSTGMESR